MSDGVARWPGRPVTPGRVAVVTVSYNTRELTVLMLWSLRRLIANAGNGMHRPALTQAMPFPASRGSQFPAVGMGSRLRRRDQQA